MALTQDVPERVGPRPPAHGEAPQPSPAPAPAPPRRAALVGVILGGVVASALVMATFIWYRSHAVDEPTTAVIIEGNPALDGALITVTGSRVVTTRLSASRNYVATVLLEPGHYRVSAEHRGRLLLRHEVEVKRFLGVRIKLSDPGLDDGGASAAPATLPAQADTP